MSKKSLFFLSLMFSLFFIPSCHYIGKKACCAKKAWSAKKGKACCAKKLRSKKGKACCGKISVAGQAVVTAVNGSQIKGEVFFESVEKYTVKVTANFKGLKAKQKFGFHVHEFGNCENKALTAGGHLNPWKQKHGGPQDEEKHLGDLGNLESDAKGQAVYSSLVKGRLSTFLGRSVIVHAKPDDLKSQPTGNAGNRIACGVIVAAMPPVSTDQAKEQKADDKKVTSTEKASSQKTPVQKATAKKAIKKTPTTQKATTKKATEKTPTTQKATTKKATEKTPTTQKAITKKATKKTPTTQKAITKKATKKTPTTQKAATKKAIKKTPTTQKATTKKATKTQNTSK